MSSVDDRIVNMQFNNKQFVQGAADSQKALEGLDKTIAGAAKGPGMTSLGTSVDTVKSKFSALQVAGAAALATIVSKATTAGLSLIKSLTIDPLVQGFQEYQTNLNSVQTVVSNTGESVSTVNDYMLKLNAYSDQTIYNFSQMAKNIGTFTAAGVDLETATSSIQGIANLAALSGSSSEQASTAMYQLSQAISAGKVGLQDWNSVVNAGMGGKQFQTALANTAVAMGDIGASSVGLEGPMQRLTIGGESFRQSISAAGGAASWLSSDVLVSTLSSLDGRFSSVQLGLKGFSGAALEAELQQNRLNLEQKMGVKYTDAQFKALLKTADAAYEAATVVKTFPQLMQVVKESIGSVFANSFSIIMGNFNQSKKLWTNVGKQIVGPSGFITKMGTAWTGMLQSWVDSGGRTQVIKGFGRLFRSLGKIMGAVKGALSDVFPPGAVNILSKMSKGFNQFTKNLMVHKGTVESLRSIFGGIFAVFHIGWTILKAVGAAFGALFGALGTGVDKSQGGVLSLLASVGELLKAFDQWISKGGNLVNFMTQIGAAIGTFLQPLAAGIGMAVQAFSMLVSGASEASGSVTGMASSSGSVIDRITAAFERLKSVISGFAGSGDKINKFFQDFGKNAGSLAAQGGQIAGSIVGGIISGLAAAVPILMGAIGALATGIIDGIKSALGISSPSTEMVPVGENVAAGLAEGITAGGKFLVEAIASLGKWIMEGFVQLFGGMDAIDIAALINSVIGGAMMLAITNTANAVTVPFKEILQKGLIGTFTELGNTLKAMQQGIKAKALLDIALAVGILVASIVVLSLLKPEDIAKALGAITVMMGQLVGSLAALSKLSKGDVNMAVLATSMLIISAAMINLAIAVAMFGNMDLRTLGVGFGAIALGLGLMVGAMWLFAKIQGSVAGMAGSMLIMALAMNVLATAVLMFGNMSMETLTKGLGAMAIGLMILVGAMRGLDKMKGSTEGLAASVLIIAAAMVVLSIAVGALGSMDVKTLAKGLGAIAVGLILFVGALYLLSLIGPMVPVLAASIMTMSAAMVVLAVAVGLFGGMDAGTLAKGFIAIAAGLLLLIGAAFLAQFVAAGLIVLGVTLQMIGLAMLYAGLGMMAFAAGMALLAVVGAAGVAVLVLAFQAFMALLPVFAMQLAAAFVTFVETIAAAMPRLREAFGTIFENLVGVVTDAIPVLGALFSALIDEGLRIIREGIPKYVETGMTIIDEFLTSMSKHVPHIADVVGDMIVDFIEAIDNDLQDIIQAGTDLIVHFLEGMAKSSAEITTAAGEAVLDILNAIDSAIVTYIPQFQEVGMRILGHIIDGMTGGMASAAAGFAADLWEMVKDAAPGPLGSLLKTSGKGGPSLKDAIIATTAAANALIAQGDPIVTEALRRASQTQRAATAGAGRASAAEKEARDLEKKAQKKGAGKGIKKRADKARKIADRQAAAADKLQSKADAAADAASQAIDFRDADEQGKGDIKTEQANAVAARAAALYDKAEAEAAQARKLAKSDPKKAKKLREDAARDRAAAERLVTEANTLTAEAKTHYKNVVNERLEQIRADVKKEADEKAAQAAFDKMTTEEKIEEMKRRAAQHQIEATNKETEYLAKLAEAERLRDAGQFDLAMAALDEAEQLAQEAQDLAAQAAQETEQAAQLANQPGSTGAGGGAGIRPSRSVLEDAARAVDRYTESLNQAIAASAAAQGPVQYTQNNYSPAALSPSEVYRGTKNLLSAQEFKMGVN